MWDMTSLLSAVYQSKLATTMYSKMESSIQTSQARPETTRMAFDSQMRSDAAVYRQASQNMTDAKAMVEVAQTGVTGIKQYLNDMYEIATEAATLSGLSSEQYQSYSQSLNEMAGLAAGMTSNISFNGMSLLNGTAGMNSDGVVVLQGGDSQIDQDFTNLADSSLTSVLGANGSMNLNLLAGETTITDQASAQKLADDLESYIQRLEGLEANYSYDIKGLENLSLLYEDRASTFENTIQYQEAQAQTNPQATFGQDLLDDILSASSGGSVFNLSS